MRQADENGDGELSFEEARKAFPNLTRQGFDKRDRNGDGVLSPADRKNN
jgi:hypothetical protein